MKEIFDFVEINFLNKNWVMFGIIFSVLIFCKLLEIKDHRQKYGAPAIFYKLQIYLFFVMYLIILIFGISKIITFVLLAIFVPALICERLQIAYDQYNFINFLISKKRNRIKAANSL